MVLKLFLYLLVLVVMLPVADVIHVLSLVDFGAASLNGLVLIRKVAISELKWLMPLMIIGIIAGTQALLIVPPRPLMAALGIFVIAFAINGLIGKKPTHNIAKRWVVPIGLLGGFFGGLFGNGGFIYVMYLGRRSLEKDQIRATQVTLLLASTITRVTVFLVSGVYADVRILGLAAICLPAMLLGIWIGHHVSLKMSREQFLRAICLLLIVSGSSLIIRAWII